MWLAGGDVPNCSLSLQTFLNPWYVASLVPIYIITFCMGVWAFFTAGGSFHNILKCLSCKKWAEQGGGTRYGGVTVAKWGCLGSDFCMEPGAGLGDPYGSFPAWNLVWLCALWAFWWVGLSCQSAGRSVGFGHLQHQLRGCGRMGVTQTCLSVPKQQLHLLAFGGLISSHKQAPPPKNSPAPCVVKHSPSSSFLSPGKQEDDSRVMMYSALQVPFED